MGGRVGLFKILFRAHENQLDEGARQWRAFVISHGAGDRGQAARALAHRRQSIRGQSNGNDHRKSAVFGEYFHRGRTSCRTSLRIRAKWSKANSITVVFDS